MKRPWWYFFCENTYKNTLKNVTTNREVFLNFSAAPVKIPSK
ncbi:hypothetical protein HMPREF0262_00596 [Clostridium sp. ATCC 29733]|nr:hypothetical protein HMPREF0262_00596 [Clostridium sp. ATCC 29733]